MMTAPQTLSWLLLLTVRTRPGRKGRSIDVHVEIVFRAEKLPFKFSVAWISTADARFFYARRCASAVLAMVLCLCLSKVGVQSIRPNESSWFMAWELPSTYPASCYWVCPKIRVLRSL